MLRLKMLQKLNTVTSSVQSHLTKMDESCFFCLFVFSPENQQSTAIISQELSQVAAHRGSVQASILESHSSRLIKKETDFSDPPRHTAGRNVVKYNYTAVSRS